MSVLIKRIVNVFIFIFLFNLAHAENNKCDDAQVDSIRAVNDIKAPEGFEEYNVNGEIIFIRALPDREIPKIKNINPENITASGLFINEQENGTGNKKGQ